MDEAITAGHLMLIQCAKMGINPEGGTLRHSYKYCDCCSGETDYTLFWCLYWIQKYDCEDSGGHSKEKPSRVFVDGHTEWMWEGQIHRDGNEPAVTTADGKKRYFKNGEETDAEGQPLTN